MNQQKIWCGDNNVSMTCEKAWLGSIFRLLDENRLKLLSLDEILTLRPKLPILLSKKTTKRGDGLKNC